MSTRACPLHTSSCSGCTCCAHSPRAAAGCLQRCEVGYSDATSLAVDLSLNSHHAAHAEAGLPIRNQSLPTRRRGVGQQTSSAPLAYADDSDDRGSTTPLLPHRTASTRSPSPVPLSNRPSAQSPCSATSPESGQVTKGPSLAGFEPSRPCFHRSRADGCGSWSASEQRCCERTRSLDACDSRKRVTPGERRCFLIWPTSRSIRSLPPRSTVRCGLPGTNDLWALNPRVPAQSRQSSIQATCFCRCRLIRRGACCIPAER